jgi:peptide/nickel transport system substrate-binding protein
MRHIVRNAVVAGALAVVAAAPLARAQSESPDDKLVLRVGTTIDLTTDNPFAVSAGSDWVVTTTQYDMLLKFAVEDLTPAPSLATGCTPNDDSTEWTCTIRDDVRWSDGEPLTSEDIAFTYRFVIDHKIPQYKSYFPFKPTFETPDPQTLIWRAEQPTFAPDMPPWVYIVPEHIWSPYADPETSSLRDVRSVDNAPAVGSGPFVLTEWTKGQGWTMERNPNFWGDEPAVDEVQYRIYSNQEALVQALRNGEVDIADGLQPSLLGSLEGQEGIVTQKVVSDWWLNLAFNFGGQGTQADPLPALHDLTLRQAIAMAIDKREIVEKAYFGAAEPGDTIIRKAAAYWHLDIPAEEELPYDPAAANQLLEDAGYVDTDDDGVREDPATGQPLVLRMPASSDTTGAVEAGQLIVAYLDAIGIQVDLKAVTDAKMNDYWGAGNFDAYIWYWSGDPDPNYQLFVFTSEQCGAWSDGCWKDPEFDALYEQQYTTMDREARLEIVQAAQRRAYEQLPSVVLAYPNWVEAYRTDRFEGWVPSPGADGYLLPTYNYDTLVELRPVASSTSTGAPASPGVPGWVWVAVVGGIVAVVVGVAASRRRGVSDEDA